MSSLIIFIPARSGSTRVKNKNLQKIGKLSLLEHKIKICKSLKLGKVVVSTNSKKIAKLSIKNGAEIPFLRPKKYSTSKASTVSAILHYLRFLKKKKYEDTNLFSNTSFNKSIFRKKKQSFLRIKK